MKPREFFLAGEAAARRYSLAVPRGGPVSRVGPTFGARAGSSLEFRDYRGYAPGDDLRHVDWNAYARTDQLTVKLFREEVSPHLDILLDGSRSMALVGSAKEQANLALAGFFSAAATNAGFSHAGWLLAGDAQPLGSRDRNPVIWDTIRFDDRRDPSTALASASARWRPRGVRVLLSDLLWNADPARVVRQLADRASSAVVLQVLAEADANPPVGGYLRLIDSETDEVREVRVDASMGARYRANLTRLQGHWNDSCRGAGVVFATVIAEEVLQNWRMDTLVAAGVLQVG
jgi:uncharacterized protein (DUF58 family)